LPFLEVAFFIVCTMTQRETDAVCANGRGPMGEATTETEPVLEDHSQEEAQFLAAFAEDSPAPPAKAEATKSEAPAAQEPETTPTAPEAETEAEKVNEDIVHLSKSDYEKIMKVVDGVDNRLASAFGKFGPLEQRINKIQEALKPGEPLVLTDEDFAEMRVDFPELAGMTRKAFERIAARMSRASAAAPIDSTQFVSRDEFERLLNEERTRQYNETKQATFDAMTLIRPDWQQVIGIKEHDNDPIPETSYRKWLATQPQDYQDRLNRTWNPAVMSRSIEDFEKHQNRNKPTNQTPPSSTPQRSRLSAAVTPRGSAPVGKAPRTEEDDMMDGFAGR
jgi:hypothetical protein